MVGIEPTLQVLETRGLPLTDTPIHLNYIKAERQKLRGGLLQFRRLFVRLDFPAEFAVFIQGELAFALCIHVDLIPVCGVILVFTDGTN